MLKLTLILLFKLTIIQYANTVCNVCNDNGMACINEKEFHPCINAKPNTAMKFSCLGEHEICTNNARVCMNRTEDTATVACGNTLNCGKCEGEENDGKYTCTSRTTFTMCFGGVLSDIRDTCPKNHMCDVGLGKQGQYPCVPNCKESQIEFCDLYNATDAPEEITASTNATTTANTQSETVNNKTTASDDTPANSAELFCSQQSATGRYSYPGDTTCQTYIYCYRRRGAMRTTISKCKSQLYFNPSTTLCENIKPNGCV